MYKTRSIVRSMTNHLQNKKILIIDDDIGHCEVLGLIFEDEGAIVYVANDGQAGLRQLYITQPDLVIVDVMMPVMNGWEVCRQIRMLTDIPVIMLTTLNDDEDIVQGFNSGADDFISKPFSAQVLKVRAEALLRRRSTPAMVDLGQGLNDSRLVRALAFQGIDRIMPRHPGFRRACLSKPATPRARSPEIGSRSAKRSDETWLI